jgi:hypothetical protein
MATLITAGCGISQQGFDKWTTWPKYCELTHQCKHINVGGPASGNEHIARSVIRGIYESQPDAVIVVWTSYNKLDVYVEDPAKESQIKNFPSRNFLINYLGKIVDAPAWWPSSVSDDNVFKNLYKETLESDTYYYIRTLESVLAVQNLCRLKNISCYMFLGYEWDVEKIKSNEETSYLYNAIDWQQFVSLASLEADYERSTWFEYNTTKTHGMVPVAGWHYEFYVKKIIPLLDHHYKQKDLTKFWQLEDYVLSMTQDCYQKQIS